MKMLKLGVIGLGDIARKAYLPVYAGMTDVEFHLYTRNKAKLEEISQKYRLINKHSSFDSLINAGITAAFVHSSTESHYEIVKELLNRNIHVYVDKPITYDYETSKELVELAESKNLILMIGFNRRFAPFYRKAKEVANPNMVILQKNRHRLPNDARYFVFDDYIHVLDTVRFMIPADIEKVTVTGRKVDGLLYHVVVQFHFENGGLGIAIMNRDNGSREEKLEVMGPEEKKVVLNLSDLFVHNRNGETKLSFNDWDTTLYKRGFEHITAEFIDAVKKKVHPSISARDALKTHEICEQIVRELENN
jgi:virulence factor